MRALKEALINKSNIENVHSNEYLYIIFPFGKDDTLYGHDEYLMDLEAWDIYILNKNDIYDFFGCDPLTMIAKLKDPDTKVWGTYLSKEDITKYFKRHLRGKDYEHLIDHFYGNKKFTELK